ncbi:ribonuclease HII [Desulfonema ishimotonii]|uniref:Ribonuclease HII n=1 Tax=Desulfonema ishimotonii TaxID=45657 RepID=A0A401FR61_9BACT|nr:ribonuclease HII [Desulfonema ishimotonii]GBC59458.1 ribonuclease HII [Desulfonema ishimotonii]
MRAFEKKAVEKGFSIIAGVDEAGRGPLAGPVVSAAVILPDSFSDPDIDDSKKLSPKKRERLFDTIRAHALSVGVSIVGPDEIDRINIFQASLRTMLLAVRQLTPQPDYLLVDGKFPIPALGIPQEPIIKGDSLSLSIASASIIAKVTRDRLMADYDAAWPQYGFAQHKGYPTKAHREAIREFGPCPIHRRSFKGVREYADPLNFRWPQP